MTNQLTFNNFVETRNSRRDVTVANPYQSWQQIGHVESLADDGTVFIRWHNGNTFTSTGNRPTSIHHIDDVAIL